MRIQILTLCLGFLHTFESRCLYVMLWLVHLKAFDLITIWIWLHACTWVDGQLFLKCRFPSAAIRYWTVQETSNMLEHCRNAGAASCMHVDAGFLFWGYKLLHDVDAEECAAISKGWNLYCWIQAMSHQYLPMDYSCACISDHNHQQQGRQEAVPWNGSFEEYCTGVTLSTFHLLVAFRPITCDLIVEFLFNTGTTTRSLWFYTIGKISSTMTTILQWGLAGALNL